MQAVLERDPDLARAEAREAREWITTDLGYEANAKRLMDVYERALAELDGPAPDS